MQPVFKTSKRSYTYLPIDSPENIKQRGPNAGLEGILNSPDEYMTSQNVSPQNEYLGETASRLKVEITEQD